MVSGEGGQLYTIEGVAAGLIMIMTAYLVVNATSVYTAGDTHINDMQLEVLGSDALKMMGTPTNTTMNSIDNSTLRTIVESNNGNKFNATFFPLINNRDNFPGYCISVGFKIAKHKKFFKTSGFVKRLQSNPAFGTVEKRRTKFYLRFKS